MRLAILFTLLPTVALAQASWLPATPDNSDQSDLANAVRICQKYYVPPASAPVKFGSGSFGHFDAQHYALCDLIRNEWRKAPSDRTQVKVAPNSDEMAYLQEVTAALYMSKQPVLVR